MVSNYIPNFKRIEAEGRHTASPDLLNKKSAYGLLEDARSLTF